MAMLALAVAAGCEALAVHVDHGLRLTSGDDAVVVRAAARALGASCQTVAVTVRARPDLEARARPPAMEPCRRGSWWATPPTTRPRRCC